MKHLPVLSFFHPFASTVLTVLTFPKSPYPDHLSFRPPPKKTPIYSFILLKQLSVALLLLLPHLHLLLPPHLHHFPLPPTRVVDLLPLPSAIPSEGHRNLPDATGIVMPFGGRIPGLVVSPLFIKINYIEATDSQLVATQPHRATPLVPLYAEGTPRHHYNPALTI
ncbi:hypothetical protein B9Z19DRAFT_381819 [Tuber borchii]|uniref:Uncharacterized protein n=1 Tax=Tuber borchii TaxID=42251 RepID=A0A2T6ZHG8_TUBBO|nr:hypothetical protein B9Z19DRAFT_381819 [Tuber borchii]